MYSIEKIPHSKKAGIFANTASLKFAERQMISELRYLIRILNIDSLKEISDSFSHEAFGLSWFNEISSYLYFLEDLYITRTENVQSGRKSYVLAFLSSPSIMELGELDDALNTISEAAGGVLYVPHIAELDTLLDILSDPLVDEHMDLETLHSAKQHFSGYIFEFS
jgi:hypothetical protein